jgi:hypothetical protein
MSADAASWPSLPLSEWQETYDTLHMWMQIVGKTRLALAPPENHWWHVALYVTARGLTTSPMPYGDRMFEATFDFTDHRLVVDTSDGVQKAIALRPQSVASFYEEYRRLLDALGIAVKLWPVPVEVDHTVPFPDDRGHAAYDANQANRFFKMLQQADRILKRFKGRFLGKSSPVHYFWGAGDLALTRFNGHRAPPHADSDWWVLREANSHEEISVGFWPGSGTVPEPAFYAYARPEPANLGAALLGVPGAYYNRALADFILPYESVRTAPSPDAAVLDFCQAAYDVAATLGRWDRAALDRPANEWP